MSDHEFRSDTSGMRAVRKSAPDDAPSGDAPQGVDPEFYAHGIKLFEVTWSLVGNDLPSGSNAPLRLLQFVLPGRLTLDL
jgi:hypothetical protein